MTEEEKNPSEENLEEESLEEELSTEELAETNHFMLNALLDLLVEKKVITEEEFDKKLAEFEEEETEDKASED